MKKFWNWIKNSDDTRILRLEGPIDEESFWGDEITPQMFRDELESGEGDVTVWINSPGGNVFAAAEIYTMLKDYKERIVPALEKKFNYSTVMQVPRLEKIVINQGIGEATQDKKLIDIAVNELTAITGQKAVPTLSRKDISNFKLRKKMPVGVRVTLRRERMYEFLERLVRVALPRIRDFKGIEGKLDGRGNYTLGITEQIIFPEINIDNINKLMGMNITFVTSAPTDEEGYALLKEFGLPFKNAKN